MIRLKLDDIDWFEGRLIVRAGKNHRERSLPLSQEVGDVLVSYLRDARPATPHREIFLRWRPPFHPLRSSVTITALVAKALKRAGVKAHRPGAHILRHTLATLIGLIASTGLRVSEAMRLTVCDIHLDADPSHLEVHQTKFRKSRLVALHSTTTDQLRLYAQERKRLHYAGLSDAFFVSEQGSHLRYDAVWQTFTGLAHRAGIRNDDDASRPCIHGLRHSFAVGRLLDWYRRGLSVNDLLPTLSVYMGHVQPANTYWYLTATPELLNAAGEYFQKFAGQGVEQ